MSHTIKIAFDINTGAINNPSVKLNVLLAEIAAGINALMNNPFIGVIEH